MFDLCNICQHQFSGSAFRKEILAVCQLFTECLVRYVKCLVSSACIILRVPCFTDFFCFPANFSLGLSRSEEQGEVGEKDQVFIRFSVMNGASMWLMHITTRCHCCFMQTSPDSQVLAVRWQFLLQCFQGICVRKGTRRLPTVAHTSPSILISSSFKSMQNWLLDKEHLGTKFSANDLFFFSNFFFFTFIYFLRDIERQNTSWGGAEKGDTESEAGSRLSAQSLTRGSNSQTMRS